VTDGQIRRVRGHEVYRNDLVVVHDDEVEFASGRRGRHARVGWNVEGAGVVLLPTHARQVALVRTFRYPLDEWQWALPRGFAHGPDPLETARAELLEELGASDAQLALLGHLTPDSGLLSTRVAVVHAALPSPDLKPVDADEVAETRWVSLDDLTTEVGNGRIEDGFTLAALSLARALGVLP
jgi:ADP-ribose pyrophosphatase